MIQNLKIKNFQSHRETELDFDPGVNIIVGASDSGKTAILRALRWLVWNRPGGEAFRSRWGGETRVELTIDQDRYIRSKDKDNTYQINDAKPFKAFGTDVPDEIKNRLQLNEINLQQQLDSPFLLTETSGEVAKHFNRIAHLDHIDNSLSQINSATRKINQRIEADIETRTRQQEQLKQYEHLYKVEADLEVLEGLENHKTQITTQGVQLGTLLKQIATSEQEIKENAIVFQYEEAVDAVLDVIQRRDIVETQVEELEGLINRIEGVKEEQEACQRIIAIKGIVEDIDVKIQAKNRLKTDIVSLQNFITMIADREAMLVKTKTRITKLEERWHEEMPEVCPLCGK